MTDELTPAKAGLTCPFHGETLRYRQDDQWVSHAECDRPGCGFEVLA